MSSRTPRTDGRFLRRLHQRTSAASADLDADEATFSQDCLPARTGQPTGDSGGPKIDVLHRLLGDGTTVADIGELQHAARSEGRAETSAKARRLSGTRLNTPLGSRHPPSRPVPGGLPPIRLETRSARGSTAGLFSGARSASLESSRPNHVARRSGHLGGQELSSPAPEPTSTTCSASRIVRNAKGWRPQRMTRPRYPGSAATAAGVSHPHRVAKARPVWK